MSGRTATIIGVTGMTGTYLLRELLEDPFFETIRLLVRRPYPVKNPSVEVKLVDFSDYESMKLAIDGSDVLFCMIGTTQKKVKGDKALYRKIDFDIPVKAARICRETGCDKFAIVSAIGADSSSGNFYLKLKGEVEDALQQSGLPSIHILQPAMLLGERKEKRPAEKFFQGLMKAASPLLPGPWHKYRSVHGKDVARAMLNLSKSDKKGVFRYTHDEIVDAAR